MSLTLNAASLTNIVNTRVPDANLTAAVAEDILDRAINKIVLYGKGNVNLRNLEGTSGTKSLTLSQQEHAGILSVSVAIFAKDYKAAGSGSSSDSFSVPGVSQSSSNSLAVGLGYGDPDDIAAEVAHQLQLLEVDWSEAFF